jgi:mannose-6-phosphate isomerase-like protein (cupin superfamily)
MSRFVACILLTAATLCLAQVTLGPKSEYGNALAIMDELGKKQPPVALYKFAESDTCTVNLLAATTPVRAHYHAKHEETVTVLRGSGVFTLGSARHEVRPGDVMHIVRGTVHAFVPSSKDVVVVSIFSPKFDGTDRVFVDGS